MRTAQAEPVRVARRGTPREINRQIVLNLVRAWQPVSRADLARLTGTRRGAISLIVNDLIAQGMLYDGAKGETPRGRKPQFLYIDSRNRCVIAVDVRPTRTTYMVTDLLTEPVIGVSGFATEPDPGRFIRTLAGRTMGSLSMSAIACERPPSLARCVMMTRGTKRLSPLAPRK